MKNNRVLIIGHRNPDSDSVCSAIGYAYLKSCLDKTRLYIPCRAGSLNDESAFILSKFNLETPLRVDSVAPTVEDLDLKKPISVRPQQTVMDIARYFKDRDLHILPLVNEKNVLLGVVDKMDSLRSEIFVAASQRNTVINRVAGGEIVILGDRGEVQFDLIKAGCSAMIITGAHPVSNEVLRLAKEKQVLIVSSPHGTFATAKLINLCMPISHLMSTDVPAVGLHATLQEVKEKILDSRFRCVMIVDDDQRLIGVITRTDLLESIQKQVILVDHNEISQTVDGILEADILEIIDHHRVGDISTTRPITVHNEPLGSTCSIVAEQVFLHQIELSAEIAGALLAGILSDTLLLTLSTTTQKDRDHAGKLASIAGLDLTAFGKELIAASVNIEGKTAREILFLDFKTYHLDGKKIGVNQIMILDHQYLLALEPEIKLEMERLCQEQNYTLVAMLIMNPLEKKGEEILVKGDQRIIEKAFAVSVVDDKCFVPSILSRKKDFVPRIGRCLAR